LCVYVDFRTRRVRACNGCTVDHVVRQCTSFQGTEWYRLRAFLRLWINFDSLLSLVETAPSEWSKSGPRPEMLAWVDFRALLANRSVAVMGSDWVRPETECKTSKESIFFFRKGRVILQKQRQIRVRIFV